MFVHLISINIYIYAFHEGYNEYMRQYIDRYIVEVHVRDNTQTKYPNIEIGHVLFHQSKIN